MSRTIHVVDYGVGNLYSVARAIEKAGGTPRLTSNPNEIARADRLLLPGVGAFRDGMAGLHALGIADSIVAFAASGRPLLGICLGMQMLATESHEYGHHRGLDVIPGRVEIIAPTSVEGARRKVPSIGWVTLDPGRSTNFAGTILDNLTPNDWVYLVHSFEFLPDEPADLIATYSYGGSPITAAVARDNIVGCQFHPEKSGQVGLQIIERFLAA